MCYYQAIGRIILLSQSAKASPIITRDGVALLRKPSLCSDFDCTPPEVSVAQPAGGARWRHMMRAAEAVDHAAIIITAMQCRHALRAAREGMRHGHR